MTQATANQSRLRSLYHKRRGRLIRYSALYGAAVFAALQIADVAFPALGVPDSVTRLIIFTAVLGFPFVVFLAVFGGRAAAEAAPPRLVTSEASRALPAPNRVAVLPFAVSGDPEFRYLGEGLVDLLSSKLCCAGDLRHVDPHALVGQAHQLGRERMGPELGREIAHRFGAGLFVLGNVLGSGGRLHIDATVYRCTAETEAVGRVSVEGAADQLFELIDELSRELLTALVPDQAPLTRLAATTTESLDALAAYLEGEGEMRAVRREPAARAFRRAVEADPTFSLAWYRLAVAALWSGQLQLARDASQKAVETAGRLAEHTQLLVQAFDAFIRGDADEAERLYRTIVGVQPNDVEAWYQLGEVLFHYRPRQAGSVSESRFAWERVLDLEPNHVSALVHLAFIAACDANHEEVESLVDRTLEISPTADTATWLMALRESRRRDGSSWDEVKGRLRRGSDFSAARAAWFVGASGSDLDATYEVTKLVTEPTRSIDAQTVSRIWLAHIELARGRWNAAMDQLHSVEKACNESAIVHRALLTLIPFFERPDSELRAVREAVAQLSYSEEQPTIAAGAYFNVHDGLFEQLKLYLTGALAARLGDNDAALHAADRLGSLGGRPEARELAEDQAIGIRARVKMNQGDDDEALRILEGARKSAFFELTMASPFYSQALERFLRAELLRRVGRTGEALRWYDSFAEHSIYDLIYLPHSKLRRAQILDSMGRSEEASDLYGSFATHWADADPEFAHLVDEARERSIDIRHPIVDIRHSAH